MTSSEKRGMVREPKGVNWLKQKIMLVDSYKMRSGASLTTGIDAFVVRPSGVLGTEAGEDVLLPRHR